MYRFFWRGGHSFGSSVQNRDRLSTQKFSIRPSVERPQNRKVCPAAPTDALTFFLDSRPLDNKNATPRRYIFYYGGKKIQTCRAAVFSVAKTKTPLSFPFAKNAQYYCSLLLRLTATRTNRGLTKGLVLILALNYRQQKLMVFWIIYWKQADILTHQLFTRAIYLVRAMIQNVF